MEEHKMYAYRCKKCGKLHHPRYIVCQNPECDGREFDPIELGGKGKLLTWTRVYNLPEGFTQPWLNFGIVEFENGVRVTGQIGFDDIVDGMEVVSTVGVVRNFEIRYKESVHEPEYGFIFQKP
jgi:Predicted nucleic-acid-binding protein containing a Zn-ribbon